MTQCAAVAARRNKNLHFHDIRALAATKCGDHDQTFEALQEIIRDVLGVDRVQVRPEARIVDDLGAD